MKQQQQTLELKQWATDFYDFKIEKIPYRREINDLTNE